MIMRLQSVKVIMLSPHVGHYFDHAVLPMRDIPIQSPLPVLETAPMVMFG